MQVVIDIPDEEYKKISNSNPSYADDFNLYYAIKNGTPLPKGHGALIDVDNLIGKIHGVRSISAVIDAPTIIPADKEGENEISVDNNVSGH